MRDPRAYLRRLRERAPRLGYLLVEKILAPDEALPEGWGVDGTTGYEFANLLTGLLTDPEGEQLLARTYAAFTGRHASPAEIVREAKLEVMAGELNAELQALTGRLLALCDADLGRATLGAALAETVAALDVYRTYADADGMTPEDRRRIADAVDAARVRRPDLDPDAFAFLQRALTPDLADDLPARRDACLDFLLRAQQFTGPVMAKGLEDTALYRFNPLIARNEVGSRPGQPAVGVSAFHAANADRLEKMPRTMLTTSTHDTKRGEDARARITAIARHARVWDEKVAEWNALLADPAQPVDRNEEYFFYQLLLGAWPTEWRRTDEIATEELRVFADRVTAAMLKSSREAGVNTRWTFGDARYEAALAALVGRALAPQSQLHAVLSGLRGDGRRGRHRDLARPDCPEAHRSRRAGHLPGGGTLGAEHGRPGQPSPRGLPASDEPSGNAPLVGRWHRPLRKVRHYPPASEATPVKPAAVRGGFLPAPVR